MKTDDDDPLDPEERKIMSFMLQHCEMSPRDFAKHFNTSVERIRSILDRDLRWVMKG